jgi:hypothetical protein
MVPITKLLEIDLESDKQYNGGKARGGSSRVRRLPGNVTKTRDVDSNFFFNLCFLIRWHQMVKSILLSGHETA